MGSPSPSLRSLTAQLQVLDCAVEQLPNVAELLRRVHDDPQPDAVFLELLATEDSGLDGLGRLRRVRPELKVVVLAPASDVRSLVEAIRLGAHDYVLTPMDAAEVAPLLERVLGSKRLNPAARPIAAVEDSARDLSFIAASPAMRKVRMQAVLLADVDLPLLILGESGTGKEMTARLIHRLSMRSRFPFHKLNCAVIPPDLLEAELFGYGAAANAEMPGRLQMCQGGTLLLDEICDMPLALQARLVEFLASVPTSTGDGPAGRMPDVRIFAACQGGVELAVADGRLREDLYYRLNAFTLHLPPLRERQEEMNLLLNNFVERLAPSLGKPVKPIPSPVVDACRRHTWAGNLREMESFVRRYLIAGEQFTYDFGGGVLAAMPRPIRAHSFGTDAASKVLAGTFSLRGLRAEAETGAITRALQTTNWNRKQAARLLKISYRGLLYKMRQFNITPAELEVSGMPETRT